MARLTFFSLLGSLISAFHCLEKEMEFNQTWPSPPQINWKIFIDFRERRVRHIEAPPQNFAFSFLTITSAWIYNAVMSSIVLRAIPNNFPFLLPLFQPQIAVVDQCVSKSQHMPKKSPPKLLLAIVPLQKFARTSLSPARLPFSCLSLSPQ